MSAGILSSISFGVESTFGTAVTPNKSIAVRPGDGIQTNADVQMVSNIRKLLAKNNDAFKGQQVHEGEFEVDFIPGVVGYFLKSVFGGLSSALKGGESVVYEHTFTEAEAKPSLTIEQNVTDLVRRYAGSIATSMRLACNVGETLVGTFGFKAKSSASASAITPTYETTRPFNFADALAASGLKIGGTAFDEVENLELEYNNNGEMKHVLGANDPSFFFVKGSEVTGSFDLYMNSDSAAKFTDYINKTERSLDIIFTGDAIGVGSNYKLDINVPRTVFTAATFPVRDDYNVINVEFNGLYDNSTSRLIRVILTNLTANYN